MGGRAARLKETVFLIRKNFQTLEERMSAESRARAEARAEELLTEEGRASIHDLSIWMEASFAEAQKRAGVDAGDDSPTSEAELEHLVGDALRKSRIFSK